MRRVMLGGLVGVVALVGVVSVLLSLLSPLQASAAACGAQGCGALSSPHRDSVYAGPSHPDVDALHYALQLRWSPHRSRLSGVERMTFRMAQSRHAVYLALGRRAHVTAARLDGHKVRFAHPGRLLVVQRQLRRDTVHTLTLRYHEQPPKAPPLQFQRNAVGMFRTKSGDVFTNDEPIGAYQWYAVNDQPADKAFYDFRLTVPRGRVGVANGRLVSRHHAHGLTVTRFHLDRPASSYLTTVEFGRYTMTRMPALHGTPLTLWTPRGDAKALAAARKLRPALAWDEARLGTYPFATLSLIVVKGYNSGMENQTLITVGDVPYDRSYETLVHEVAHQWYGDEVTPGDWIDVWMNEGMAMYLEDVWNAQHEHEPLAQLMRSTEKTEAWSRSTYGPPGDYDPSVFAAINIYYGPALMWDQLRKRVGDVAFWSMVKAWPQVHAYGNADRTSYLRWIEARLGSRFGSRSAFSEFLDAWLMGTTTPPLS